MGNNRDTRTFCINGEVQILPSSRQEQKTVVKLGQGLKAEQCIKRW